MARTGGQFTPNMPTPAVNGLKAWSFDPGSGGAGAAAMTAATIYLARMDISTGFTASKLWINCPVSGTGATAVSNAQCGLYSSAGVLLGSSAAADMAAGGATPIDETTAPVTLGVTLVAASTGSLILSAGTFVWGGVHVGTQASTAAQLQFGTNAGVTVANFNLTAAFSRAGQYTGHASNNLTTIGDLTPASITQFTRIPLMGLS